MKAQVNDILHTEHTGTVKSTFSPTLPDCSAAQVNTSGANKQIISLFSVKKEQISTNNTL